MIRNIPKENSTYTNDTLEKPFLSLTIRIFTALGNGSLKVRLRLNRDCAEESSVSICHMGTSPSIGDTPTMTSSEIKTERI